MKKGPIIAIIVGIVIILAVIVGAEYSKRQNNQSAVTTGANRTCTVKGNVYTPDDDNNSAAKVGANETRLTCESFASNVDKAKGVVMVDMYLPTCPHCQKMGPIISEIADETVGKYKIGKIDVSKYPEIGTEFNIESVPAFIFFKDGKEVARLVGEQQKQTILDKLNEIAKK